MNLSNSFIDYPTEELCISVYYVGCDFRCEGCHNVALQEYGDNNTQLYSVEEFINVLKEYSGRLNNINKVAMMGGDPLALRNRAFTYELLERAQEFDFCLYTGYELEDLDQSRLVDTDTLEFIKTGIYDTANKCVSEKTSTYFQLASSNQKLYNGNLQLVSKQGKFLY